MNSENLKIDIIVVEDNVTMREGMVQILRKNGHTVRDAAGGEKGLGLQTARPADLVITDYKMAPMDGLELLKRIRELYPGTFVMVITAFGSIDLAVKAMQAGAWDFVTKPFSKDELTLKVDRVSQLIRERRRVRMLEDQNVYLQEEMNVRLHYGELVGESRAMRDIYKTLEKVSRSDASVLIYGESGTGKELVARAVHHQSARQEKPFIRVSCGALAEGILESELFGHEKGAFTGALRCKKGRFELADQGTLFLDEIGDISPGTQIKLLRVLQEKEFERVGGEDTLRVDVRVLAATNKNLKEEVEAGRFREDLYYRLHILPLFIPPLRERKEDIGILAGHFLSRIASEMGKPGISITEDGLHLLTAYPWPGNVRELENVVERAVVLAEGTVIDRDDLAFMLQGAKGTEIAEQSMDLEENLASLEKKLICQALEITRGVKAKAARLLGIKEGALYYKMDKYGLSGKE